MNIVHTRRYTQVTHASISTLVAAATTDRETPRNTMPIYRAVHMGMGRIPAGSQLAAT